MVSDFQPVQLHGFNKYNEFWGCIENSMDHDQINLHVIFKEDKAASAGQG